MIGKVMDALFDANLLEVTGLALFLGLIAFTDKRLDIIAPQLPEAVPAMTEKQAPKLESLHGKDTGEVETDRQPESNGHFLRMAQGARQEHSRVNNIPSGNGRVA